MSSTLGPAYTHSESSGELVNATVEGVEVLDEYITTYQPARLLAVLVPVFVLLVIFLLDPPTTLILIVHRSDPACCCWPSSAAAPKRSPNSAFLELSWMSAFFLDMLQGLATLKMFGRSREQIENIRDISRHYGNTTMEVLRTAFQTGLVLEWGGTVATALVAVEVSLRLMSGLLPFDRALAVLIITPEFFLPLRQLAIKYHAGTAGKAAADRIFAILDTPINQPRAQITRSAVPTRLDIRFDHVDFAYAEGQRPALQDFSLHIPQGGTIALVGATGAGKTTVAQLLLRFIEPDRGSITVDERPPQTRSILRPGARAWRGCRNSRISFTAPSPITSVWHEQEPARPTHRGSAGRPARTISSHNCLRVMTHRSGNAGCALERRAAAAARYRARLFEGCAIAHSGRSDRPSGCCQ